MKLLRFIECFAFTSLAFALFTVACTPQQPIPVVEAPVDPGPQSICRDGFSEIPWQGNHLCVMNDYYMENGIRMPIGMSQARQIADSQGLMFLTAGMVDAVWRHADVRLTPIPTEPDSGMVTMARFIDHHAMIEDQLTRLGITDTEGLLIAGHKKDIVQQQHSGRVTIYGWHRTSGSPIQPVSSVHGAEYRDYSHGLRLGYIIPRENASD